MSNAHGKFVWYELMTTDPAAAAAFYAEVVGWRTVDSGMPGMTYTLLMMGETHMAGLMDMPPDAGANMPPNWLGYVGVDDVDATAAEAERLGGRVHAQPRDIAGVGRFAVIADPQGAVLALFRSERDPDAVPEQMAPGGIGWHELLASDWAPMFDFYAALFGWRKHDALDMGPMGSYQLYGFDQAIGGMFTKPPSIPFPFWLYYFNVPDIDAAMGRVTAAGGTVLMGPMAVPGGAFILQAQDPQGAVFALVGMRSQG
jgi:predicted enzyme related to lactoylglutathione lyase